MPLKDKTILVVDDEKGYREVLSDEFEIAGARVLAAENGSDALTILQKNKIDAVISDIRMPGGSGVELLDQLRAIDSKAPFVMLITGHSDLSTEDAYDKGADALVFKPCKLEILVESVKRALLSDRQRWVRELIEIPRDLKIELKFESLEKAVEARVLSLGRGGMFIAYEGTPVRVDSTVGFQMQNFEGLGICRWVRHNSAELPNGIGIEFTDLSEDSFNILMNILFEIKPKAFIPKSIG